MLKRISSKFLVAVLVLSPIAVAHAAIEPDKALVIDTQPKAFIPSVTLKDVSGTFTNVVAVKISLSDEAKTELSLHDLGNRTWETKLNSEQVKALLGNKKSEKYSAKLVIQSKNDKGRMDSKVKNIEVVINGDGASL